MAVGTRQATALPVDRQDLPRGEPCALAPQGTGLDAGPVARLLARRTTPGPMEDDDGLPQALAPPTLAQLEC